MSKNIPSLQALSQINPTPSLRRSTNRHRPHPSQTSPHRWRISFSWKLSAKKTSPRKLNIAEAKLELTKLSANSSLVAPPPVSPVKLETVIAPCSTPAAPVQQFNTLDQLRTKKKSSTSLPNNYLFSAKGTVDYDKLDLVGFVSGF